MKVKVGDLVLVTEIPGVGPVFMIGYITSTDTGNVYFSINFTPIEDSNKEFPYLINNQCIKTIIPKRLAPLYKVLYS